MQTRIYPAIDILGGKCVRLYKGDFEKSKIYSENPLEKAKYFEDSGADFLHIVDLDAAKGQGANNAEVIKKIVSNTGLRIQTGGGIKKTEQLTQLFDFGADRIIAGSIAVSKPDIVMEWLELFGPEKIVIGADISDMHIATHGWQKVTDLHLFDFLELYKKAGATKFLCTDIALDGTLMGSAQILYQDLMKRFPDLDFIASGGVKDLDEIRQLISSGMESIIIGKAIYEGYISLEQLFMIQNI